jgi:hypothetical protein
MSYKIEHKGKTVELPDFKNMPVGVIRKARKLEQEDQMWFIIESVLDEKQLAVIDALDIGEFNELMSGWTQGAPLGESLQSSKS